MKKPKIIKTATFSAMGAMAISICIIWPNRETHFKEVEQNRLSAYNHMINLTNKIIGVYTADSLSTWADNFDREFYDGEIIPPEDSMTLMAMRRFKFELNDKLNGTVNILDPTKFDRAGRDLISACQLRILRMTKSSAAFAKND